MKELQVSGIVGLTGYATCGKDMLCQMLIERGRAKRFALADKLKNAMNPFLIEQFGIDVWNCPSEDKELIRPLLVDYGKVHRVRTKGTYFTSKIEAEVKAFAESGGLSIITDIRYADPKYPEDEIWWLQNLGGKLVHISKYWNESDGKRYVTAPNSDELENNVTLLKEADRKIEWEHCENSLNDNAGHVNDLVDYLNNVLK